MTPRGPGRPPLPEGERRVDVHVRLRPETLARLDEVARELRATRTDVIERCVWIVNLLEQLKESKS